MDLISCSYSTVSSSFKFLIISMFSCNIELTSFLAVDYSLPPLANCEVDLFYSLRCCASGNFIGTDRSELTRDSSGTAELANFAFLSKVRGVKLSILEPPFSCSLNAELQLSGRATDARVIGGFV